MGGGSWNPTTYTSYATTKGLIDKHGKATAKAAHEIFTQSGVNQALEPKNVKVRESCDSKEHPESNAVIIALDVTGSMHFVSKAMAQVGLPTLMKEIYERKPVGDPQVMFMGFDDIDVGGHFQVSQFESDIRIAEQLSLLWLEGYGGGNDSESYSLPWLFAADHTAIDCYDKRKKKGYIFTIGDELPNPSLGKDAVGHILGYRPESSLDSKSLLKRVQKRYNVFHVIAQEGSYARSNKSETKNAWEDLLGDNALVLPDHTKIAEVIVSAIQISEGVDADKVAKSWDSKTAAVVAAVTKNVKRIVEV